MKVILLENIKRIGSIGEVIDVKRGFARNFLIANKKALYASKENIKEVNKEFEFAMHRLVALAFVPNDDPKKTLVDHVNGVRCDYKIENLRWATASENSRGSAGQSSDPDAVYEIVNQTLWFHGKMGEYEGAKELYNKQKEQADKQLNYFDIFEKELIDETQ